MTPLNLSSFRQTSLLRLAARAIHRWARERQTEIGWLLTGRSIPAPPSIKRAFLRKQAMLNQLKIFVETGTLNGDTIAGLRKSFDQLHSIELGAELYCKASARFEGDPKVKLWLGDSAEVLPLVLNTIQSAAIFWLDGHYSGEGTARGSKDTPIRQELAHIANHPFFGQHLVVVDDARCFLGSNGYPNVDELRDYTRQLGYTEFASVGDYFVLR